MKRPRFRTVLEAIHAENPDERAWLASIIEAASPIFQAPPAEVGFLAVDHSADGTGARIAQVLGPQEPFVATAESFFRSLDPDSLRTLFYPPQMVTSVESLAGRMPGRVAEEMRGHLREWRSPASVGVTVHPEPGAAAVLYSSRPARNGTALRSALTRIGLHLETSLRLRRRPDLVRAIVSPDGKVQHRVGDVDHAELATAVSGVERARLRKNDDEALDLWPALVAGRLSLVERFEGGRRFYFAVENAPATQPIRALGAGELNALSYATRGLSLKMIAYALGVTSGEASRRLANAATKVGLASTLELVRIAAMFARDPRARFAATALTATENDILALLEQGLSNKQIAALRNRSVRTIANQVASLLRKTGKPSRRALVARS